MDFIAFALSATLALIASNFDNLALLVAIAVPVGLARALSGYVLAQVVMLGGALVLAAGLGHVLDAWVGLLGIVPLTMGVLAVWRGAGSSDEADTRLSNGASLPVIVSVFLSMSMDSLALMTPLLAESHPSFRAAALAGALFGIGVMAVAVLVLVQAVRRVDAAGRWLERLERVVPYIMILAGAYVLWNSWTDMV